MNNPFHRIVWALLLAVCGSPTTTVLAESDVAVESRHHPWQVFAFDNGVGRDRDWKPSQQAKLTAQLGYDGIGYTQVKELEARYIACESREQRIFSFYEGFDVSKDQGIGQHVLDLLPQLEGKNSIIWLHTHGKATEAEAVFRFRAFADEAAKHKVRVAIYPHVGNYLPTAEGALRVAKAVNRQNFGMSINVCHELKAGNGDQLVELAKASTGHLFLVSINGADNVKDPTAERDWSRLILPVGEGDFDLLPFLQQLHDSGYAGPIGFQCYRIPGEIEDILRRSLTGYRKLITQLRCE